MIKVATVNSIYTLDLDNALYSRQPVNVPNVPSQNLTYGDWHEMDSLEISDNILTIHYPDANCPHQGGSGCQNSHFIQTTPIVGITQQDIQINPLSFAWSKET